MDGDRGWGFSTLDREQESTSSSGSGGSDEANTQGSPDFPTRPTKQDSRIQADTFPLPSQRTDMGRSRPLGHYHEHRVGSAASVQRHRALGPQAATHMAWRQDDKAPTPRGHQTQPIDLETLSLPRVAGQWAHRWDTHGHFSQGSSVRSQHPA